MCHFLDMVDSARDLQEEIDDAAIRQHICGSLKALKTKKLIVDLLNSVPPSNRTQSRSATIIRGLLQVNKKVYTNVKASQKR